MGCRGAPAAPGAYPCMRSSTSASVPAKGPGVSILIDTSASMTANLKLLNRAAELDPIERQLVQYLTNRQLGLFIRAAVLAKKNIAVVGDTGSGKTTLMKSICQTVPEQERLITIEDVRERAEKLATGV